MGAAAALLAPGATAAAQDPSIGGFIPLVGIGYTAEFKTLDALDLGAIPFIADPAFSVGAPLLGSGGDPFFDVALLDTGAATHILTQEAFAGFDIQGAGLRGTNTQIVGGATGTIVTEINDAAGIYAAGLGDRTSAGASLGLDTSSLRGQTSIATLTAPEEWTLPNILGLPFAAQHGIVIRNDQPQIFQHQGRTVRTPQVDFIDLGSGADLGITRRAPLVLRPGIGFIQGPQFVFNLDLGDVLGGGGELSVHNNPASPSVVQDSSGNGGGLFIEVDLRDGDNAFDDKQLLFDTGADLTVLSQIAAKRLGFDAVLDEPDFVLEVEGSGGVQGGVPGFFADELNIDTVGGSFTARNVPIAVLDVTNPNDPGNIIDGILGTNVFNGRNLVIDAEASFGQGGVGPSLYISDPVTNGRAWADTRVMDSWHTASNWQEGAVPDVLSDVLLAPASDSLPRVLGLRSTVSSDAQVFRLTVAGEGDQSIALRVDNNATFTAFGEVRLDSGGLVELAGGKLDAQFINIDGGALTGTGDVFVGTGILSGAVRNLSGVVSPGNPNTSLPAEDAIGTLRIDGDYTSLDEAVLAIEIEEVIDTLSNDRVEVSRFAFLAGTLLVDFQEFDPLGPEGLEIGDMFTILTADEGVFGEFDALNLPAGFLWDVQYNANSVVLEVTGFGLAGDFNADGVVNAGDYTVWRDGLGSTYTLADYQVWVDNYGLTNAAAASQPVPEPAAVFLLAVISGLTARRSR